jgi:hypothetical protein
MKHQFISGRKSGKIVRKGALTYRVGTDLFPPNFYRIQEK